MAIALSLFSTITGTCPAKAGKQPNPYLSAIEAFSRKDFAAGIKKYYRFVSFSEIILSKQIRENDLDEAQVFFEDAARQTKDSEKALLFLVMIDRITENWDRAHARIDTIRQKHPRSLLLAYIKGEIYLAQNQVKEAKPFLDWVLQAAADSPIAKVTRALLGFYLKSESVDAEKRKSFLLAAAFRNWDLLEIDQAIRLFQLVADDFPSEKEAFRSLVCIYLDRNDTTMARAINDRWKSNNKEPLLDPMTLVKLHLAADEYSEAASLLEAMLRADPGNEPARLLLADCLYNLNKFEEALKIYSEILPRLPGNMGVISRLIHCLESFRRYEEAIALLEAQLNQETGNPWIQLELAELYLQTGNHDQAEVYYDLLSGYDNPYTGYAVEMSAKIAQYRQEKAIEELERAEQAKKEAANAAVIDAPSSQTTANTTEKIKEVQIDELKKLMAIYE